MLVIMICVETEASQPANISRIYTELGMMLRVEDGMREHLRARPQKDVEKSRRVNTYLVVLGPRLVVASKRGCPSQRKFPE